MERQTEMEQQTLLRNMLLNEPLIESRPSLEGLSLRGIKPGESIYYGTGLCSSREISTGLPFDVLSMVLVAERLRRSFGLSKVYHHIADTHALANSFLTPEEVALHGQETKKIVERMVANLGLGQFEIVLSSEFDQTDEYRVLGAKVKTPENEYVERELTDMLWYQQKGVSLKIGWIIQATETKLGFDERLFDREFKRLFGDKLSFVYLKAGRTLDPKRPKASPYISIPGEKRLLLRKGEDVEAKLAKAEEEFNQKNLGGARNYFIGIVRNYERIIGPLGEMTIEQKIQAIIDKTIE